MQHTEKKLFSEPLIAYLCSRGWAIAESEPDIAVLRKMHDDQEEEIVLPRDRSFVDYHQRVAEAIQFLSDYEHRPIEDIFNELLLHS